jgi:hypothetical protein
MPHPTLPFDYGILNQLAAQVYELEVLRIGLRNRREVLTRPADKLDADGIARGFAIPAEDPILEPIHAVYDGSTELEKIAVKALERYMRRSPWRAWLDSDKSKGVGAKQLGRLLGAIGDPYWHSRDDRPRLVSELWSYCGYDVRNGQAPRRQRGAKANWSEQARMRAWNVADRCIPAQGHYYWNVYLPTKAHYADAVHDRECVRCGPKGKPAALGTPLSKGHIDARARRAIAKEVLEDLWLESRRQHGVVDAPELRAA